MNKHLQGALIAFLVLVPWLIATNTNQWGKVQSTAIMTNVNSNTTSSVISTIPSGGVTFKSTFDCGASDCAIVWTLYGNEVNSTTGGEQICQVTFAAGATSRSGTCPTVTGPFLYWYVTTTGVAGTTPTLDVTAMY